jgi:hypothetical protein
MRPEQHAERRDDDGAQRRRERGDAEEAGDAALRMLVADQRIEDFLFLMLDACRVALQDAARFGELEAAAKAQEQDLPQRLLEVLDALGQRRLRDVQALGRAREVELAGQHHEGLDLSGRQTTRHASPPRGERRDYNRKLSRDHRRLSR